MVKLLNFSHDRRAEFQKSCDALLALIEEFSTQRELSELLSYYNDIYSLPSEAIKQQLKLYFVNNYDFVECKFDKKLFSKEIRNYAIKHILFLFYSFCYSKNYIGIEKTKTLTIECAEKSISKFARLITLFDKRNVFIFSPNLIDCPGLKFLYRPSYKFYDRVETVRTIYHEMIKGNRILTRLSKKIDINLFPVATHILNKYLYYLSVFKYHPARFSIQTRPYETNTVRNFLFKRFGGKYAGCIQRNILPIGANGNYYDADVFFSFGNKTADRAFQNGARIECLVPVGSFSMENSWFYRSDKEIVSEDSYDIVFIGINVSMAFHFLDSYDFFIEDYYDTFKWVASYSKQNPRLRIGIKHKVNNKVDNKEMKIIEGTSIERIDERLNTYEIAFKAKCCVTYGSTMGYELIGHGVSVLYLDPGDRCVFLPKREEFPALEPFRAANYKEFEIKIKTLLKNKVSSNKDLFNADNFCYKSNNVSNRIYSWFSHQKKRRLNNDNIKSIL